MDRFRQYEQVRIRQLLRPPDEYNGWGINQRPPRVGDVGYLIDILQAPGVPDSYVVECSGPGGVDIWLGDFTAEEIEPVPE